LSGWSVNRSGRRPLARPEPVHHLRRWAIVGSAATAVIAGLVGVFVSDSGSVPPSQASVVLAAAEQFGSVDSMRADETYTSQLGKVTSSQVELDGTNVKITQNRSAEDGGRLVITLINGRRYAQAGGHLSSVAATGDNTLAPYPGAARDVVKTVAGDSEVTKVGAGEVRGTKATHYHLDMPDAARQKLSRLPKTELAWFDLDSPQDVTSVDVWVTGKTLRRITVNAGFRTSDAVYYDFGAPITITTPTK
jgi:hypothetical protein